ncbi:PAS domain S-box protein [Massilia sp. 9096]|uniref:PAS domain-containing hybrid sensor histidine kinase/response regulator n=1 Tax=Massilia sp. 9096 TaxID=1500894 RepID=UPI00068F3832|nr:PAS domain S-box protein [Massilia sp. 9096]
MMDIDELLSAENAAMLGRQLFENSPDCMKLLDAHGCIVAINPSGRFSMEIEDPDALQGQAWRALFPNEYGPAVDAALDAARRGETVRFSAMCPTLGGVPKWWRIVLSGLRGPDGALERLVAVSHDVTEAHHARRKIERSEARFRSLVTAASAMVWHCSAAGEFETEQPGWEAFTGQRFEAYRGFGWLDAVHPDDRAATVTGWRQVLASCQTVQHEHRLRRADGRYRHMCVRAVPIFEDDGSVAEWVGVHIDITERVLARIELHESRERFQKIVSQAATGVVEMDIDGRVTLVNKRFCQMLGYDEAELVGNSILDVTAPDSVEKTLATVRRTIALGEGQVIDKHYRRRDGTLMSATSSVNALRNAAGECHGLVAIVLDTTASKRDAEALRASEERYRTLFDSMDQAFCLIELEFDAEGRACDWVYLQTNSAFAEHTGLPDAVGRRRSDMLPDGDRSWLEVMGAVVRDGGDHRVEHVSQALGRWYDMYLTRVGGPGSRKVAALFRDITERRTAEDKLRSFADDLAQADRRKTDFLATLAHELRNPLAPIRSGLGVMRLNRDESPAMARVREMMERQVTHMVHLIDDLLDVARISGGKLNLRKTRVALSDVLRNAVETSLPLIEAGRHALDIDVPSEELFVDADPTRIAQVVANLLNNAAKYTPAGGRIALSLRRVDSLALIEVLDTGIGIPAAALGGLFDMFSQVGSEIDRSQGGLGIGLSLVRQLVQMHGGSVAAASAGARQGSRFTVRLPLAGASAPGAPLSGSAGTPAVVPAPAPGGLCILVVDDNVDAAVTLAMILEMDGHGARVAHSGGEALGLVRELQPDVVFLDIGMPGMDGYQTAEAIRKLPAVRQPCLVALTGWGAEHDRMRSAGAGFDHHLTKPADLGALQDLLARVAGAQAHARA